MVAPPRCQDCHTEMTYSHDAPRPDGTAHVYECPDCGATATGERGTSGVLDW